ncbi:MAG: YfhO family protein [Chloroflexia bacterium]
MSRQKALRDQHLSGYSTVHLRIEHWLDWILPHFWSYYSNRVLSGCCSPYDSSYVGLVALFGVALLLVAAFRKALAMRLILPWVGMGVFAWLLTYDVTLGGAIRALPIFSLNNNVRWVGVVSFAVLVLGSFGWDWFARILERGLSSSTTQFRRGLLIAVGCILLAATFVIIVLHVSGVLPQPRLTEMLSGAPFWMPNGNYRLYWALWSVSLVAAIAGSVCLWLGLHIGDADASPSPMLRFVWPAVVTLLLLTDLWRVMLPINPTSPASHYYPSTRFIRDVQSMVPPTERILVDDDVLPTNTSLIFNIRDWRTQDVMTPELAHRAALLLDPDLTSRGTDDYTMTLRNVRLHIAPLLGMRYIISRNRGLGNPNVDNPDQPPFTRLSFKEGVGLWAVQGVPGFTYLSDNVSAVAGEPEAAQWMENVTWAQTRAYAVMVEAPANSIAAIQHDPLGSSPGRVDVSEYTPGHIKLSVDASRASLLVIAESHYPGWQATIDDRPAPILRANYLSQGLVVPQGNHTVVLDYKPASVQYGAFISLGATVSLSVALIWMFAVRRAKRSAS